MKKLTLTVALGSILSVLAGCASTQHIAEIQQYPGRYHRTIAIEGRVVSSWSVPLVPFQFYQVDDGTGRLTVVATDRAVPRRGARVRVVGKVEDVASLGGRSLGLHLRQENLRIFYDR